MEWLEILKGLGVTAGISAIIPMIFTLIVNKRNTQKNNIKLLSEDVESLKEFRKEHEEVTQEILDSLREMKSQMKVYNNSQQALLRNKIIELYNQYSVKKEMTIYARESLDKLYEQYKQTGGNGMIESLVDKLSDLPIKPPDVDDDDDI